MSGLRSYLNRGGKILLTTDSYYSTPNLDALLAEFGLSRTEGLVMEGDSDHSVNGYPTFSCRSSSALESGVLDGTTPACRVLLQMAQGSPDRDGRCDSRSPADHHRPRHTARPLATK